MVFLPSAQRDLLSIFEFLKTTLADADHARRMTAGLEAQCLKLSRLPGTLGRPRPDLMPGLRSFPFRGYLIFFRYRDKAFEIIDIIEGHRDVATHLAEETDEGA